MIYSLHIPKCGGYSLLDVFRQVYGKERVVRWDDYAIGARAITDVIHGHFSYGEPGGDGDYVTVLRHPVERAISNYYHHVQRGEFKRLCKSLYLYPILHPEQQNLIIRQLLNAWGDLTETDLERAKAVLRDFATVGFLDRISDFVKQLAIRYRWPIEPQINHHNPGQYNTRFDKKRVEEWNSLDMELYRWAEITFRKP